MLISSLTNGMMEQRFTNLIEESMTHVQIHHPEFMIEREPQMYIENPDQITTYLENQDLISSFTARTITSGMIQSPQTTSGVQITGIRVDWETATTTFHENLIEGNYLDVDIRNALVIGKELANKLNMEIGNRVVLTFQSVDNELTSASFNITGVFKTTSAQFDERNVYVRSSDLSELIAERPLYHEIAMVLNDADDSAKLASEINREFPWIKAETWYQLSPELRYISDFGNSMTFYVMLIIMLALAFGILNTMLMAIFERMRELGMLMAVGMSKLRIFLMIMLESVILTFTGGFTGIVLASITINWLGENGIDMAAFGGESLGEFGYDTVVFPVITSSDFTSIGTLVVATALLSAVYPAIKALRIKPADVVRD